MLGDDWPSPPTFQYLFLENPWPLTALAGVLAVSLFIIAGRRGQTSFLYASLGALIFGVSVYGLASFVETDRETVRRKTAEIIEAFAADPFDRQTIEDHVTDDVTMFNWSVGRFMPVAESAANSVEIDRYFVRHLLVEQDGPNHARTGVSVLGQLNYQGSRSSFSVQAIFHWRRRSDNEWQLYHVPDVEINGRDGEEVIEHVTGL